MCMLEQTYEVRGMPQSVFLYVTIFYIAKALSNLILNFIPSITSAH
jgi:hypothetical protein